MNATTQSLKVVASAVAALALTMVLSWTFVDATAVARVHRDSSPGVLTSVSALVR
jgi:hypothetical protein